MANSFFNDSNKAYSENLNDGILVGNAFDWTVDVSLPTDTGGVFPNSSTISMAKVADVYISPNSNLSIGSTISNSSGSSQVYRLTVYPNFNRYGGFKSISVTASSGVTFYVANKGASTPIANNLDYSDLSSVPELKVLKEYDIVLTIPNGKSVSGLEFVFQSSSADVSGSISQSNVTGLNDRLDLIEAKNSEQDTAIDGKVDKVNGKALSSNDFTNSYKSKVDRLDNNTWQTFTLQSSTNPNNYMYCFYKVNTHLRLVEFKFYKIDHLFTSPNESYDLGVITPVHSGDGVPLDITPNFNTILSSYNPTIVGGILGDNGHLTVASSSTGTKNVNLSGMWHY